MALLDDTGAVIEQYLWEPYGSLATLDVAASPRPDNSVGHQGLFSYRFDGMAGPAIALNAVCLYFNRNRWYSPNLGRFTSRDPNESGQMVLRVMTMNGQATVPFEGAFDPEGQFRDGLNLYLYVTGNPVDGLDPAGLKEHHLYPLHLGGPGDGPGLDLDDAEHSEFHEYLRKKGYPYGDEGREKWRKLPEWRQRQLLTEAAAKAGIDVTDPEFQQALRESFEGHTPGHMQDRKRVRKLYSPKRADRNVAGKLVSKTSKGLLDTNRSKGKGLTALGMVGEAMGVIAVGMQMADALRVDNPYVYELAIISHRVRATGQLTIMDEVTALEGFYQLTGDPVSAAYGWGYWRDSLY